jgi:quercetin dioxygenase-like cupin family protein
MEKHSASKVSVCEIEGKKEASRRKTNRCAFYDYKGDFTWKGIKDSPYKAEDCGWSHIIRKVLIGSHGESTKFHVRYFEVSPGGYSSLEKHMHEHVVICVKGKGIVRTGRTKKTMGFMDVLYISPDTVHQLINPFEDSFGFLCIVNSKRDKPRVLTKR